MDALNELDALAASTDANNAATTAAQTPVDPNAPPEPPSLEEQSLDGINMIAMMFMQYAPETATVFTPEANKMAAAAMVPVMEKYGWTMFNLPCELTAAIVVGPMLYKASKIVAEKIKADRQLKAPQQQQKPNVTVEAPDIPVSPQMALYP